METTNDFGDQQDLLKDAFETNTVYAGFWLRFAGYIIDVIVIYAVIFMIALPLGISMPGLKSSHFSEGMEFVFLFLYLAVLMYFPIMESSKWQATLGKKAVGIKVTDLNGERISFGKALARFFSKIISAIIIYIGFIMAGFTEKKQALHDMIANTLVVRI